MKQMKERHHEYTFRKKKTYLIKTCPRLPVLDPSINSSVLESWTFMYESMLTRRPLYSVWPHFSRTKTSWLMLCARVS